jgi:hypothetical protein
MFNGNIASFNPAKNFVSLLFHRGAEIPGDHPRLEGDGNLAMFPLNMNVGVDHLIVSSTLGSTPKMTSRTRCIAGSSGCCFASNQASTCCATGPPSVV